MRLTIKIPTYIEVDKFKKDHKAFLTYLSKHCIYSVEQSKDGYGYITTVVAPVQKKEVHRILDNYFKLFLEEIDEMKDTDFERQCESKPGLQYNFKVLTDDFLEAVGMQQGASFALGIWARFKALHPNTPEIPDYSGASVKRWLYHINEAEKNKGFEKVELDMGPIEAIRKNNRPTCFDDLWGYQRYNYMEIAKCFPGVDVWACGSHVRGDNMLLHGNIGIIKARQKAGMRVDRDSDYDFWVHPITQPVKDLPCNSDRYRGKFNRKEMIPIPIYYGDV